MKLNTIKNMGRNFYKWISKHSTVHYLIHIIRRLGDKRFYDLIFPERIYPGLIAIDSYGELNKDKNIFFAKITGGEMGLAAFFRKTLLTLYQIDKTGFLPVIKFEESSNWYQEKEPIEGSMNIFEYYFRQPCGINIEETLKSYHVFSSVDLTTDLRAGFDLGNYKPGDLPAPYSIDDDYLNELGRICGKYIKLNDITQSYLDKNFQETLGCNVSKVLAIHIRGTDFALHWDNHPNIVKAEDYKEGVDEAISRYGFEKIFIATDDANCLDSFLNNYGNKIVYYKDVFRGNGLKNIASENTEREHGKYLNGLEVLRDMYTLASCGGLIAGLSQVSIVARIINRSLDNKYRYEKTLSNGIYIKGRS